jgi:hypothetical protein
MYFLDPDRGARRRAQLRQGLESLARRTGEALGDASRLVTKKGLSRIGGPLSAGVTSTGEARPS